MRSRAKSTDTTSTSSDDEMRALYRHDGGGGGVETSSSLMMMMEMIDSDYDKDDDYNDSDDVDDDHDDNDDNSHTTTDKDRVPLVASSPSSRGGSGQNNRRHRQRRFGRTDDDNGKGHYRRQQQHHRCHYRIIANLPSTTTSSKTWMMITVVVTVVVVLAGIVIYSAAYDTSDKDATTPWRPPSAKDTTTTTTTTGTRGGENGNAQTKTKTTTTTGEPLPFCQQVVVWQHGQPSSWKEWLRVQSSTPAAQRCGRLLTDGRTCQCHSPVVPWDKSSRTSKNNNNNKQGSSSEDWQAAFARNKKMVWQEIRQNQNRDANIKSNNVPDGVPPAGIAEQTTQQQQQQPLDILFLGDSITEHWLGTDMGIPAGRYKDLPDVFEEYFGNGRGGGGDKDATTSSKPPLRAMALGIGGDRTTNLLYRILAGELPDELNARLYWILIGTNDFGGEQCSVDMVTAATIWIAHVILQAKPDSHLVLNAILPRGKRSIARNPMMAEILAVNQRLECYANSSGTTNNNRVHFYNTSDLFLTSDRAFVNMTLMPDGLHPNRLGSELWAQDITRYALDLLAGLAPPVGKAEPPTAPSPVSVPVVSSDESVLASCQEAYISPQTSWKDWVKLQGRVTIRCTDNVEDTRCGCRNPLQAVKRTLNGWDRAHQRNLDLIAKATTTTPANKFDVVMFGDSITEWWTGYKLGQKVPSFAPKAQVFETLFSSDTSRVKGLALGVGGDRSHNLLWRIQNGELPENLESSVYWVLIGTNDTMDRCNVDMITAGILQVAATIRRRKPNAIVVLNSVLPRGKAPLLDSPRWKVLSAVNDRLECYALKQQQEEDDKMIFFFNATEMFLVPASGRPMVNQDIMEQTLHPNADGYRIWGEKIVETVLEILSDADTSSGPPPAPPASVSAPLEIPKSCNDRYISHEMSWENWTSSQGSVLDRCAEETTRCSCENPTRAVPKQFKHWTQAHERNRGLAANATTRLDVVLLGDSIVEFWATAQYIGQDQPAMLPKVEVFESLFASETSRVKGIGLGISGDRSNNLLWRIQNGELPETLDSSIYWLVVGTNDWGATGCNADMTTAGILEVVATVRRNKPDSTIVINSILPRGPGPLLEGAAWKVLSAVNERLECYASHKDKVVFFNATDLFLAPGPTVNQDIMADFLHPSADGYEIWGELIVQKVLELKADPT